MRPIRSISILIPTWQGMRYLDRVLAALAAQQLGLDWDLHVVDSGSSDGTWELLESWTGRFPVPLELTRIHPSEFDHGDTRNLLAARSSGDLLVYLTQDAIPAAPTWLATVVRNFEDPRVAAAYCRNLPHVDAEPLTRILHAADPACAPERREVSLPARERYAAMDAHQRRVLYDFNDVASAVRRELWEVHPFPRTSFGEDILMARGLLEAGHRLVYDVEAAVCHSHDHGVAETYERAWIDGRFNAEWLDRTCIASGRDARTLTERVASQDTRAIEALGLEPGARRALIARARALRAAAFDGLYEGGRSARRHPPTRLLERSQLHVLYVVQGFPPDTWAGTEVYTCNLAREMERRGHRCTILARVDADQRALADFHVEPSEFQGLRVLRMTHRLNHATLRESYHQPRAEEAFRRVLAAERPDVVHFQHLIHTSAGLVHVARERGLPTLITCHDYWALCARVQLIRPDGVICHENMEAGCTLCVKERALEQIPLARTLGEGARGPLEGLAREVAASERAPGLWRRRASEYLDMAARPDYVLSAYAAADLLVSPSRFLREKLLATGRFDPQRFVFSDNGMRTDHIQALAKRPDPAGRLRFGFVGSLVWYKGGEVLLRAMARLAERPALLNVFGDFQPERDEHHAHLARLAGPNVRFRGRFDNARLSEVHAEIDVLVVPSVWFENSPITIHEAFLTHTPLLVSDIGGMLEFVRDGVDGLHFSVGDHVDLARKMQRLMEEPGLLQHLAQGGREVKTIAENAAETEFRYRALACRVRE